ncbi:MAG: ABC transporter ATP-binding protein [Thalassobius sp.]|nr:ABC transporter ATP-binding protein [Thalassovita sp.]
MIEIEKLSASYDDKKFIKFPDWQLSQGETCLMLGPSGSGKSTLLHLLSGILQPKSGSVKIANTQLFDLTPAKRDKFRGKNIGLIFQKAHLIDSLSVKDNMLMAQYFAGEKKDLARVKEVLAELHIGDKLSAKTFQLSQGEAQRLSIARAMLNEPSVILADEPTSSLDDENCEAVYHILETQAKKYNATLLISTHDQRLKDKIPLHLKLQKQ